MFEAQMGMSPDETFTYDHNLKEFVRVPPNTDIVYNVAALKEDQKKQVAKLPKHQFPEARVGSFTVKGMYGRAKPDRKPSPKPENQDCLMLTKLLLGMSKTPALLAGVYDGHGSFGRVISHVSARHVAEALGKQQTSTDASAAAMSAALHDVMLAANTTMSKEVNPDAYRGSGSTATAVLLTRSTLVVGNVGDSHMVKLSSPAGSGDAPWVVTTSTSLHNVDSPAELERLKAAGAEIWYPPDDERGSTPVRVQVKDTTGRGGGNPPRRKSAASSALSITRTSTHSACGR